MPQFQQWSVFLTTWQQLQVRKQRSLIVLKACESTYNQAIPALIGHSQVSGISVNIPELGLDGIADIQPQQAKQYLGRSHNILIYQAIDEFNINSFCALCGTLVAGGLAIIIVPDQQAWEQCIDKQAKGYGYNQEKITSPFRSWWQGIWDNHHGVMILSAQAQSEAEIQTYQSLPAIDQFKVDKNLRLKPDQDAVVKAVTNLVSKEQTVFCLSGARGRGKTVALAAALSQLAKQGVPTIITSAASQSASSVLQQHSLEYSLNSPFIAIDQLLELVPKASQPAQLVVVEEAASMPMALLQALMTRYSRLVLVSSQDGYEGSGQGLAIKLPLIARREGFSLDYLELTKPMRWLAADPLEDLLQQSFLVKQLPAVAKQCDLSKLSHSVVAGQTLIDQPSLLEQVYSLLTLAHYQTSPQDLRLLLDHPDMSIHIWLNQQDQLVGVACVMAEGGLASPLTTAIARGERRVQGHLLPQILAQQAGLATAAGLHMRRIQRIAVHPDIQQRGLGKQMLSQLYDYYCQIGQIDCLGASFAAEPEVVRFWLASGYFPVWAGQRLDTATALPSVQVVLPISHTAQEQTKLLQAHFFYYCLALEPTWQSPLAKEIIELIRPCFKPINTAFLTDLITQVGGAKGNIYAVKPYLYQRLLRAYKLPDTSQVWLGNYWQSNLTQKQFVALTRDLVVEWHDIDGDDLSAWL
ncbi:MAG: hypothetical protein CMH96_00210 [Oceanospirillaceae bacterium]|nr:hypothetical protein [Oceanospirillaceae bacterium]